MAAFIVETVCRVGSRSSFAVAVALVVSVAFGSSAAWATERAHVVIGIEVDQGSSYLQISGSKLVMDLRSHFSSRGWRVEGARADDRVPANVRLRAVVDSVEPARPKSCLRPSRRYPPVTLRMTLRLSSTGNDVLLAEVSDSFVVKTYPVPNTGNGVGIVPTEWSEKVASALEATGALVRYEGELAAAHRAAVEAIERKDGEEEARAWKESSPERCAEAASLSKLDEHCSGVSAYLARYQNGRYREDAHAALSRGACHGSIEDARSREAARISGQATSAEVLNAWTVAKFNCPQWAPENEQARLRAATLVEAERDDGAWRSAQPDRCRNPKAGSDCEGVEGYLRDRPDGAHSDEARKIAAAASSKIAALRSAEARRARVAELKSQLCVVLGQIDELKAAEAFQRRVDAASGTTNLTERRRLAASLIVLEDRRDALQKGIRNEGGSFQRDSDCAEGKR